MLDPKQMILMIIYFAVVEILVRSSFILNSAKYPDELGFL